MEQLSIDFTERSDAEIIRDALVKEINNLEFTKNLVVEANKDETISIRAKTFGYLLSFLSSELELGL